MDSRSTDQIVAEVCAALSVESVEIRRTERNNEGCNPCMYTAVLTSKAMVCALCGSEERPERYVEHDEPQQQIVRTAPFAYFGNDRLDVSPKSTDPIGAWFAPSAWLTRAADAAWSQSVELGASFARLEFEPAYTAEMRVRYGIVPGSEPWDSLSESDRCEAYAALPRGVEPVPAAWDALLAMREVTLVCTCADAVRCHRVLLARILEKLGARYAGEVR